MTGQVNFLVAQATIAERHRTAAAHAARPDTRHLPHGPVAALRVRLGRPRLAASTAGC